MRSDDIRRLTVEASERALVQAVKVRARGGPDIEADVMAYEKATEAMAEFWRRASPAFCFAWFAVISEDAE